MSQLPVPGRDTVYVWVCRGTGDQPEVARRMLVGAGVALLGRDRSAVSVGRAPDGRPRVRAGGVELPVSVSHVEGVVVVAACRAAPVGVDVERHRPVPAQALARRWFEPAAAGWVAGLPAEDRVAGFLLLWTAKEAVGKALGSGLRAGGLARPMPLPDGGGPLLRPLPDNGPLRPVPDGGPLLRPVPGASGLRVGHPDAGTELVVAVAVVGPARQVVVDRVEGSGHEAAVRSASVERTSFPVVVRGS
ncbi:4'-phosphopantetheinyl transferase family protein [Micromonospora cathayae]|uniref:4'-phosphopantetheinyl transferase superfamily protein n=1 Tax=Micromonospora cathayae TaxID=3028804 RepID=A0ABY7ZLZ2_9ACTN|nr:4'-phosphopantetheinyl transferase superfamily protein [Micromonospora sp. HUAS 3]WDZ82994.1 4'-phosphopantetheinyl transferase superfamily protein [Micromonospora sp. HUAS 3]